MAEGDASGRNACLREKELKHKSGETASKTKENSFFFYFLQIMQFAV